MQKGDSLGQSRDGDQQQHNVTLVALTLEAPGRSIPALYMYALRLSPFLPPRERNPQTLTGRGKSSQSRFARRGANQSVCSRTVFKSVARTASALWDANPHRTAPSLLRSMGPSWSSSWMPFLGWDAGSRKATEAPVFRSARGRFFGSRMGRHRWLVVQLGSPASQVPHWLEPESRPRPSPFRTARHKSKREKKKLGFETESEIQSQWQPSVQARGLKGSLPSQQLESPIVRPVHFVDVVEREWRRCQIRQLLA